MTGRSCKDKLSSRLRRRVIIQNPVRVSDGGGGYSKGWADVATMYAAISPASSKERLFAFKLKGEVSHAITIRYLAGIKPKMRVVYSGRYFGIKAVVNPSERNERLVLLCDEEIV